jgi:hypothetical protein
VMYIPLASQLATRSRDVERTGGARRFLARLLSE